MAGEIKTTVEEATEEVNIGDVFRIRREKLAALCEAGENPFEKVRFDFDTYTADIHADFEHYEEKDVRIAG